MSENWTRSYRAKSPSAGWPIEIDCSRHSPFILRRLNRRLIVFDQASLIVS